MEHEDQQPELSLPALLPGSEFKTDDSDRWRTKNITGMAIAIVVYAHKDNIPESQRQAWFDLWENERKNADQHWKKVAKFNYRHDPGSYRFQAPDTDSENRYMLLISGWLKKSLLIQPDWNSLYSLIASQLTPSERHNSEWWAKLRDICKRATTATDTFDPIAEIQKISEEYRIEQEQTGIDENELDDIDKRIVLLYQEGEKEAEKNIGGQIKLPGSRKIAAALHRDGITKKQYSHEGIRKRIRKLREQGLIGHPDDNKDQAKRCTPEHIDDMDVGGELKQKF